jgi:hypothetical protein
MAFDSFKSIAEVLTAHQITSKDAHFLGTEPFTVPDSGSAIYEGVPELCPL